MSKKNKKPAHPFCKRCESAVNGQPCKWSKFCEPFQQNTENERILMKVYQADIANGVGDSSD